MADGSLILNLYFELNSPTLKNFSLDRVDIPSIKLLNIKTHLVYDGTRIKWSNDLISLKNFTENIVGLVGCWRSPGGKSKQFVNNDLDLTMTWQNSLLFSGKDGESLKKLLISILNTPSDTTYQIPDEPKSSTGESRDIGKITNSSECPNQSIAEIKAIKDNIDGVFVIINKLCYSTTRLLK